MSVISSRIDPEVEKQIKKLMRTYNGNVTSLLCQFPSQQIAAVIDAHAASIQSKQERDMFFMTTQGVMQLIQK